MAKRKGNRRNSSKCPEPFNTMIDLAGAIAIDYIRAKKRKKGGNRSRIDPYAAAGVAMGMGRLNSTEDIIALGGLLGAMGAFDDDSYSKPHDNRYAWRLNCEDGSAYGVDPADYETRAEYNAALAHVKGSCSVRESCPTQPLKTSAAPEEVIHESYSFDSIVFCRVSRLDNGANVFYRAAENAFCVGDKVVVPVEDNKTALAIVLSISKSCPTNEDSGMSIISKA